MANILAMPESCKNCGWLGHGWHAQLTGSAEDFSGSILTSYSWTRLGPNSAVADSGATIRPKKVATLHTVHSVQYTMGNLL